jgi:hypothetical protein
LGKIKTTLIYVLNVRNKKLLPNSRYNYSNYCIIYYYVFIDSNDCFADIHTVHILISFKFIARERGNLTEYVLYKYETDNCFGVQNKF